MASNHVIHFPEWRPDCGGDWVLSGSWALSGEGFFANYWPDNTVVASILDGFDGNELATSGIQAFASKAQCQSYAECWIKAELIARYSSGKAVR